MKYPDIIQIMPAEGWEAHYDAGPTTEIVDVACWALHRNSVIAAMICGKRGELMYATERTGFKKIVKLENQEYV